MPARHRIATVILLSSTLAAASPTEHAPPPPDDKVPAKILALRGELRALTRDEATKQLHHFRALCDGDGYPLVGNIATKGDRDRMQPSTACQLIRDRPATRSW